MTSIPTRRYDRKDGIFILSDGDRAITFWPETRFVGIHSAQPRSDLPPFAGECEYLDGGEGYCDGSGSYGVRLRERWEQSYRDEQVVWAALDEWFASKFPTVNT